MRLEPLRLRDGEQVVHRRVGQHVAAQRDRGGRSVEMHLVAREPQSVRVGALGLAFRFAAGDSIWTESSYKFLPGELTRLGLECGFGAAGEWTDADWPFTLTLLASV